MEDTWDSYENTARIGGKNYGLQILPDWDEQDKIILRLQLREQTGNRFAFLFDAQGNKTGAVYLTTQERFTGKAEAFYTENQATLDAIVQEAVDFYGESFGGAA